MKVKVCHSLLLIPYTILYSTRLCPHDSSLISLFFSRRRCKSHVMVTDAKKKRQLFVFYYMYIADSREKARTLFLNCMCACHCNCRVCTVINICNISNMNVHSNAMCTQNIKEGAKKLLFVMWCARRFDDE